MGSTSDKLTYLNTTKEQLKTKINSLGGSITANTPFRDYVDALDDISGGGGGNAVITGPIQVGQYESSNLSGFITEIDMTGITMNSMAGMFGSFKKLTTISNLNSTGIQTMEGAFLDCKSLVNLPSMDSSSCKDFSYMCSGCIALANLPVLNMSSVTSAGRLIQMFANCASLTNASLENLLKSLTTIVYLNGTPTLSNIGLNQTQATTCTSFSEWTTLTNAGWTTGY